MITKIVMLLLLILLIILFRVTPSTAQFCLVWGSLILPHKSGKKTSEPTCENVTHKFLQLAFLFICFVSSDPLLAATVKADWLLPSLLLLPSPPLFCRTGYPCLGKCVWRGADSCTWERWPTFPMSPGGSGHSSSLAPWHIWGQVFYTPCAEWVSELFREKVGCVFQLWT